MQFVEWYELRKLYGNDYWKAFAKQRPHGFDSRAQLFDRLAKGDDKICARVLSPAEKRSSCWRRSGSKRRSPGSVPCERVSPEPAGSQGRSDEFCRRS
jgi:hypothetical protein